MHFVDSHCHLNFDSLGSDLPAVLERANANGVQHMLCVSVTLEKFPEVRAIAHAYPHIFASVGVHPDEKEGRDPTAEELIALADDPRIVAIGETGLDYFRSKGDLSWQHTRFRHHIRAARATGKPLIIHTREAAADTIRIMAEENAGTIGGVMHCFTESWEVAQQALDLNFYISLSGIVTFRNAEALRDVARKVPADRLLIETDSPYLAPVPFRGKTNEPAYVRHVAECVAEVRGEPLAAIAEQTTRNFFTLFNKATM
ncbi:MAG: TatD family hydrolase [Gammaproteobacteria bacterium]|nr:TatD family hydrolase [Gammaproteobacteria bacterium]